MVETNKEYFFSPYYFFISEKHDKISLYYSIAETLTESRKNDDKLDFDKKDLDKVKKGVSNILKDKKIKTKSNIKKYFDKLKQFGKDPSGKRTKNAPKQIRNKKGFIDRMTLSEIERQKMMDILDEIILNKKSGDGELGEKDSKVSKIIKKNIESLKKMADKEGLTINQIIKMLKSE